MPETMTVFKTEFCYTDRRTKAIYVQRKYGGILRGRVLDVGADECHLRSELPAEVHYWGIGNMGHVDQVVDLEQQGIPFPDGSFDCVVCLDVLEHLDNPHDTFDELCRVTARHVIVALPNPVGFLINLLERDEQLLSEPIKFYGLPVEKPDDRHKWFFSAKDAVEFLVHRSGRNGMRVVQIDQEGLNEPYIGPDMPGVPRGRIHLRAGPVWALLERADGSVGDS